MTHFLPDRSHGLLNWFPAACGVRVKEITSTERRREKEGTHHQNRTHNHRNHRRWQITLPTQLVPANETPISMVEYHFLISFHFNCQLRPARRHLLPGPGSLGPCAMGFGIDASRQPAWRPFLGSIPRSRSGEGEHPVPGSWRHSYGSPYSIRFEC